MSNNNGVDLETPTFVCAKCGREYRIPATISAETHNASTFVILGGRKVCAACAAKRFPQRRDPWGVNPDAIGRAQG